MSIVDGSQDTSAVSPTEGLAGATRPAGSRRRRLSPDEERDIARLYADKSTSTSEIRERFGIGESSLYRVVQRHGVGLRGRSASSAKAKPCADTGSGHVGATFIHGQWSKTNSLAVALDARAHRGPCTPGGGQAIQSRPRSTSSRHRRSHVASPVSLLADGPNNAFGFNSRVRVWSRPRASATRCVKRSRSEQSRLRRSLE